MPRTEYFEIVAKSALNRVQHMGFNWSLNPYQGCFHSCVYCFARAHAKLADRDPGAGFSARVGVKVNVPELLRRAAEQMVGDQAPARPLANGPWRFPEGRHLGPFRAAAEDWRLLANEGSGS